jgi:hypothetical protein
MPTLPPGPPVTCGSGKLGTPCERMHWAILSAFARIAVMPPGGPLPPCGSFELQACDADWNAGALTGTPLTVIVWPEPARCEAWICTPPPLLAVGSGKLGTPCERIQLANAIPLDCADADAPEPLVLELDLELPQPAISTAAASAGMVAYRSMGVSDSAGAVTARSHGLLPRRNRVPGMLEPPARPLESVTRQTGMS